MAKLTINEIAKKAGVSRSTVSRVLNNDPNVKDKTREDVKKVVEDMDYRPSSIARSMVKGSIPIVLVIIGDILNYYFASFVIGIEKQLEKVGYMAVVYNSEYDIEKEKKFIKMAGECNFAGIIPMTAVKSEEFEECLESVNCPVVLINRKLSRLVFDSVYVDDVRSGYLATKHLIDNGHKRIIHISGPSYSSIGRDRLKGYCQAMTEAGIEVTEDLIIEGKLSEESGYMIAPKIFGTNGATAVSSNNFLMSLGVIRYARENDLKIPDDLSIVCCEILNTAYCDTKITMAGADLVAIGRQAAEILLERINKSEKPIQKILFSPVLQERGSVKNIL